MQIGKLGVVSGLLLSLFIGMEGEASNNDPLPSVKTVMQKAYGDEGLCNAIADELRRDQPKWDEIAPKIKDLLPLAEDLGINPPLKGDKEDWKKRTRVYLESARKLDQAIQNKDKPAAVAAQTLMNDCKSCHAAHRKTEPIDSSR